MPNKYFFVGNAKIVVASSHLERGYHDGYARYANEFGLMRLPTDQEISTFLHQYASQTTGLLVYWAGFCLGWCAALLTHIMFISLPVQRRRRRSTR